MSPRLRFFACLLPLGCASLVVSGCVTIRPGRPVAVSTAYQFPEQTRLGRALAAAERGHPGKSGFHILDYGLESLVARLTIADAAEQTIDAQYYIYDSDEAGSILADHLLKAADRGVRVRLLLDDYNLGSDRELAALCAHPRIQVRVFNPIGCRLRVARLPAYALQMRRAGRRMHNKLFIADNKVTILGGRNVGNDYFNVRTRNAFRDFDVLIAGPVSSQASSVFDEYWNSPWSIPATDLVLRPPTADDLAAQRRLIHSRIKEAFEFEEEFAATKDRYLADLARDGSTLIWAEGEIVSDPPRKIDDDALQLPGVAERLEQEWSKTEREVLIEAAYFVPNAKLVATLGSLHQRGVAVRLLTSALEATDVPLVYCAYKNYRRDLLAAGVDLYEYKIHTAEPRKDGKWYRLRPSYGALHSKVMVFDRQRAWIGSFNLDPRSAKLNTEIAVLVDGAEFARALADTITEDISPERSWQLHLRPPPNAGARPPPRPSLTWSGRRDGEPVELWREPGSFLQRLKIFFLSLAIGVEDEL